MRQVRGWRGSFRRNCLPVVVKNLVLTERFVELSWKDIRDRDFYEIFGVDVEWGWRGRREEGGMSEIKRLRWGFLSDFGCITDCDKVGQRRRASFHVGSAGLVLLADAAPASVTRRVCCHQKQRVPT